MRLILLDPILFELRPEAQVVEDLNKVLSICRMPDTFMPELHEYWNYIWSELARDLISTLSPQGKRPIYEIQKFAKPDNIIPPYKSDGNVWKSGFEEMFGSTDDSQWPERMANAILRAVSSGHEAVLVTRLKAGRNLVIRNAGNSTLDEVTRWMLHVQIKQHGHKQVLCVHHPRNLQIRWTTRYDWRLPAIEDRGGNYNFTPQQRWWKGSTTAFRVSNSKYCWIDELDNGWARPNIVGGSGYHWDVYISKQGLVERIGLNQINVKEYGSSLAEGLPGQIHHIPDNKKARFQDRGWGI
ncbi:hypothetical protein F3I16_03995 [Pseudomonas sp. L-22-4S-12]|uniref:hypothetical protein n=1 Tax=Pseudomonas sp. L-22-4S-12 TaxID=2610893 RepID=UPI001328DF42|nr:hypothetical protein [Pseudomonas sp. L-22-4S-12]MWV15201.1 hypothetical protein [Pseudomonas sp. L-22-4S-12]